MQFRKSRDVHTTHGTASFAGESLTFGWSEGDARLVVDVWSGDGLVGKLSIRLESCSAVASTTASIPLLIGGEVKVTVYQTLTRKEAEDQGEEGEQGS